MLTRRHLVAGSAGLLLARPARAADPAVLRIGDQKGGAQALLKASGGLDGAPFRVEWSQFPAAAPVLEALNAGAVDAALAGDSPVAFALAVGLRARIVAATRVSGAGTAIVVPDGSPIRSAADLKGRRVGVNRGSIGHALVLATIQAEGWKQADLAVANLFPADAKSALAAGAVDGWSSWGVYIAQARLVDRNRVVADGSNGRLAGLSYLVAGTEAIAGKRAALLDFVRRLAAARRWADDNRDRYAAALSAEIGVPVAITRAMLDVECPLPVPIDAAVIADQQRTTDLFTRFGLIRDPLDAGAMFDASFNGAETG